MKFSIHFLTVLAPVACAFPAEVFERVRSDPVVAARAANILAGRQSGADAAAKIFEPIPIFNAEAQYIDISPGSGHEFVAPGPTDLRGPCPGLNAFANHNFLPHNGYATILEFTNAVMDVVGMGAGLASFLAVYGAVIDGDETAWSIGGTPPASFLAIPPLPGATIGNGISGSHNKYESDASPTRPDLYEYGNDYKTRVQQFQQLIDLSPAPHFVTIDTLTKFRAQRFNTQIASNPDFFNGPFTGVLVQPAAYTFIYRFMANHSEQHTQGLLNYDVIKSWFSITGTNGHYHWVPYNEKIPENWYRRPAAYPYDQSYFVADVTNAAKIYPFFLDIGGNTGSVNTFTGVNIANLSGGVYNTGSLSQGDAFACLAYQFAANAKPDVATNDLTTLMAAISTLTTELDCPDLENIDGSQLQMFPGYTMSPAA